MNEIYNQLKRLTLDNHEYYNNGLLIYAKNQNSDTITISHAVQEQIEIASKSLCDQEGARVPKEFSCTHLDQEDLAQLYHILHAFQQQLSAPKQTKFLKVIEDHISHLCCVEAATAEKVYTAFTQVMKNDVSLAPYTKNIKDRVMTVTYGMSPFNVLPKQVLKYLYSCFVYSPIPRYISRQTVIEHARLIKNFALLNKHIFSTLQPTLQQLKNLYSVLKARFSHIRDASLILLNPIDTPLFQQQKTIVFALKIWKLVLQEKFFQRITEDTSSLLLTWDCLVLQDEIDNYLEPDDDITETNILEGDISDNKQMVLPFVYAECFFARFARTALRDDKDVLMPAVSQNGETLKYAGERLRDDNEFVMYVLRRYGHALRYASARLRNDKEAVLQAVAEDGRALEYASDNLRDDEEVVMKAVAQNGLALRHASIRLRNDKQVIKIAVSKDKHAFHYASPTLQNDQRFKQELGMIK